MATSNADRLRWQRDAVDGLAGLLDAAMADDTLAISWTIASNGVITGTVDSLTTDPIDQRAAFVAWAHRLGAKSSERVDSAGTVHLWATFTWGGTPMVGGAIRATIYSPLDDEAGA